MSANVCLKLEMSEINNQLVDKPNLNEIPLRALRHLTRDYVCTQLNATKLIPSDDGFLRDWRGLSQLAGCTVPPNSKNPTNHILNAWEQTASATNPATLGQLQSFLGQLDRWDVYDDTQEMMEKDAEEFVKMMNRPSTLSTISERDIITSGDLSRFNQGLPLERYDAFLLHVDEDTNFATSIASSLENDFNLKLCLRDRDLLGGLRFEHDAIMRLIATRCTRLIVIISKYFIDSEAHKFMFKFAEALSIDQKTRKLVPCVYSRTETPLPPEFRFYFLLDYSRSNSLRDFCVRLRNAIEPPSPSRPALPSPSLPSPPISLPSPSLCLPSPPVSVCFSDESSSEQRCTIEELPSETHSKTSVSLSSAQAGQVPTQVVKMSDPSSLLPPVKTKCNKEPSGEADTTCLKVQPNHVAAKPVSPVNKIKQMLMGNKTSNSSEKANGTAEVKSKRKWGFSSKKKSIAVTES